MIREHDRVVLAMSVPGEDLQMGDVGSVIHVYGRGEGYEVEFVTLDGETAAVVTLKSDQVRPVHRREIVHARQLALA